MADRDSDPTQQAVLSNGGSSSAIGSNRQEKETKLVRVQDIDNLTCFICMASEEESGQQSSSDAAQRRDPFVHPCHCSLVAHESCLLQFIRSEEARGIGRVVSCPQCKTPYSFDGKLRTLVRAFASGSAALHNVAEWCMVGVVVGVAWTGAAMYGAFASAAFVGKASPLELFAGEMQANGGIKLCAVPYYMFTIRIPGSTPDRLLRLARVSVPVMAWNPAMEYFARLTRMRTFSAALHLRISATLVLLPIVSNAYCSLRKRITRWTLRSFLKLANQGQPVGRIESVKHEILFAGREQPSGKDMDTEYDDHIPVGIDLVVDQQQIRPLNRATLKRTYYSSTASVMLAATETLALPFIAASIGDALFFFARRMTPGNWLASLLDARLPEKVRSVTDKMCPPEDDFFSRNLLSLGAYVVARDSVMLLYRYSRLQHRTTRKLRDYPFTDSVAASLKRE